MTSPIASFVAVQFLADPAGSTPPANAAYDQQVFMLPPEYLTALGSGPGNPGTLGGIKGYQQAGGPTGHQWVMTSSITGAMVAQFNAIPGAKSWLVAASRNAFRTVALTLLDTYGVPAPDVLTALQSLYNAAVNNDHSTPPGG